MTIYGTVCAVLKSGGDFKPDHAHWLREQVIERMPNWDWRLWTDFDIQGATQLKRDLPKWWSKYEIYEDDSLQGPALVLDLDTVILDEWAPLPEHRDRVMVLHDPNHGYTRFPRYCGGVLYLPPDARQLLLHQFRSWSHIPDDDQPHLRQCLGPNVVVGNYQYPDQFMSYKLQTQRVGIRPETKMVYFHGLPRPWDVTPKPDWIPSLYNPHRYY
jgi:hypothetical protein